MLTLELLVVKEVSHEEVESIYPSHASVDSQVVMVKYKTPIKPLMVW